MLFNVVTVRVLLIIKVVYLMIGIPISYGTPKLLFYASDFSSLLREIFKILIYVD